MVSDRFYGDLSGFIVINGLDIRKPNHKPSQFGLIIGHTPRHGMI